MYVLVLSATFLLIKNNFIKLIPNVVYVILLIYSSFCLENNDKYNKNFVYI